MKRLTLVLVLAALLLLAGIAGAQVSPGHDLSWHVVAGGGSAMASADHQVRSTLGQVAIGPAASPGGHAIGAGYWYGIRREAEGYKIYLPLVVKGG